MKSEKIGEIAFCNHWMDHGSLIKWHVNLLLIVFLRKRQFYPDELHELGLIFRVRNRVKFNRRACETMVRKRKVKIRQKISRKRPQELFLVIV